MSYKLKKNSYLLITILKDLIFYKNKVIRIKIKLVEVKNKKIKKIKSYYKL